MAWLEPFVVRGRPITLKYSGKMLEVVIQPILLRESERTRESLGCFRVEKAYIREYMEPKKLSDGHRDSKGNTLTRSRGSSS